MKVISRVVGMDSNGELCMNEFDYDMLSRAGVLNDKCTLNIDGSTTCTGVALIRESDGAIISTSAFIRENESPVRYKIELKKKIFELLKNNRQNIERVYYEEPYIGYTTAVANLFMLRTFIEELVIENEPMLNHLKIKEINNKKWKAGFIGKQKDWMERFAGQFEDCKSESDREKKAIRLTMLSYFPFMDVLTQDEIDAAAMGTVAKKMLDTGEDGKLSSRKKGGKFAYKIQFIGADDDEVAFNYIYEVYKEFKIPVKVLENGVKIVEIDGKGTFEHKIFDNMLEDEDVLLVLKWESNKNGSVTLKYQIGGLVANYPYVYALVWRKSRLA